MPLEKGCLWKEASLWKKACGGPRPGRWSRAGLWKKARASLWKKGKEEEKGKGKPLGKGKEEEKGKGKPLGKGKEEEEEEEEEGEWVWKPFLGKYRWVKPDHNRMYRRAGTGTTSWKRRAGRVDKQCSSLAEQNSPETVEGLEEQKDKLQKALEKAEASKRGSRRSPLPALRAPSLPKSLGSWGQGWGR